MTTTSSAASFSTLKRVLIMVTAIAGGFLISWYAQTRPVMAGVDELGTLLGMEPGGEASTVERLRSSIRSFQDARNDEERKARECMASADRLRSEALAAAKERERLLAELETARKTATGLQADLSESTSILVDREEALASAQRALREAEERCSRATSERDALAQSMRELEQGSAGPRPYELVSVANGGNDSPSALARKAQSNEVRHSLAPFFARGLYQPFRSPAGEPMPFSLQAIEEAGALDRSNPESLYQLWSIVAAGENDREERWPASWAPLEMTGWLDHWYRTRAEDALPVLDRAQRDLIELGPTLVKLRLLAP